MRTGEVFEVILLETRPGFVSFQVSGQTAKEDFKYEGGGHRFQRIPPTERNGRVHTSTITVAVLPVPTEIEMSIPDNELDWDTLRGSGPGGQHRNKTESCVRLTHKPTGIVVLYGSERSQHQNKRIALGILKARLKEQKDNLIENSRNADRKKQVGLGQRGDKIRTIAFQRDQVTNHLNGKRINIAKYLKGEITLLL
jgi:peptide chain release factor 1